MIINSNILVPHLQRFASKPRIENYKNKQKTTPNQIKSLIPHMHTHTQKLTDIFPLAKSQCVSMPTEES